MPRRKRYSKPGPKPSGKWDKNRHRIKEEPNDMLMLRKREIVGLGYYDGEGNFVKADPALSEYPLGVLLARGQISEAQHLAGQIYAGLRAAHIGGLVHPQVMAWKRLVPTALDADTLPDTPRAPRDETEEEKEGRLESAFNRADNVLRHSGIGPRNAVKAVACYFAGMGRDGLPNLRIGLQALVDYWGIREEQARRAA